MIKTLLVLALLVPHLAVFASMGMLEYRRWKAIDVEDRPSFLAYLGRIDTPPEQPRTGVIHDKAPDQPANVPSGTLRDTTSGTRA